MSSSTEFVSSIIPTLTVFDARSAILFYQNAFGAAILMQHTSPDGHTVAELAIQGAKFVVADESPEHGSLGPDKLEGISVRIGLMVGDPDGLAAGAVAAGAKVVYPVADQDYGYRLGHFIDPFGHHWEIGKPLS